MTGRVVQSLEISERFLWDLRQTAQELVIENHALRLKELGHRHGLQLSIEPYDMNPAADLNLGSAADVPMCEFWSKGRGFSTEYSCLEAVSIGHTGGAKIIAAESFTANDADTWLQYPTAMKPQTDWALATGINRLVFHRYQHQPALDQFPGMTFGPYGVHWERTETWWDMVGAYHKYLARCQYMLRRGLPVADILYLTPEGAPHVFRPPASATTGDPPDRRGYNFDAVSPEVLIKSATVEESQMVRVAHHDRIIYDGGDGRTILRGEDSRLAFPGGMKYRVLVLPRYETMTPGLMKKIKELVGTGARIIGEPPQRSPSLAGYPQCDEEVCSVAAQLWGTKGENVRIVGKGLVIRSNAASGSSPATEIYPSYATVAAILEKMHIPPDFECNAPLRYTHRQDADDIFFIANRSDQPQAASCQFRGAGGYAEAWDPVSGCRFTERLPDYNAEDGRAHLFLKFAPNQSLLIVFRQTQEPATSMPLPARTAQRVHSFADLAGPWEVSFDPAWGGPEKITFEKLDDWTQRTEEGIRHYSGKAIYRKRFDLSPERLKQAEKICRLSLGTVHDMASVKLNGRYLGVVWCDPWEVEIPRELLREQGNELEITVANRWPNRLIGDQALPPEKRRTKTTWNPFHKDSPLLPSGLIGPVQLMVSE
jgi:hypothetical protein